MGLLPSRVSAASSCFISLRKQSERSRAASLILLLFSLNSFTKCCVFSFCNIFLKFSSSFFRNVIILLSSSYKESKKRRNRTTKCNQILHPYMVKTIYSIIFQKKNLIKRQTKVLISCDFKKRKYTLFFRFPIVILKGRFIGQEKLENILLFYFYYIHNKLFFNNVFVFHYMNVKHL